MLIQSSLIALSVVFLIDIEVCAKKQSFPLAICKAG